MKRLLFIVTQSEFGGAQHFITHLVTALDKNKYNTLVSAGPEGDDEAGLLRFLERKGISTRHLKYLRRSVNPLFDFCLGLIEIYKLVKREKPDILFLCSSKAGAMGSLVGRLAKVPKIIYRIGGWTFNDPRSFLSKTLYKFIEKFSAKWKDIIIVNSEHDRKQALELGIKPRDKIVTIYNGIGSLEFLSREKAREFLNLKNSDFVVGTIANDYPSKGLKYLKKAEYELRDTDCKFIIIGTGNRFIPDAHKYLKAFDIFVLPSVKEGFPWTILEAMAAEVPIVATKVGAIPEIQPGILVEPRNPEQLAEAIKSLVKNSELREKLTREAKKKVEEEFNLEKMVNKIIYEITS